MWSAVAVLAACIAVSQGQGQVPRPTPNQLRWMNDEFGAITHFNMETYQGCGIGVPRREGDEVVITVPPPSTFDPIDVDVDQWVSALATVGVKRAVLVVSHGCGFNTFPSNTSFPEFGFVYNYSVKHSPWLNGKGDIARLFVDACAQYGIRPGFYNGIMNNAFLNVVDGVVQPPNTTVAGQVNVTQSQYLQIILAQLTQLWSNYGELAEVWFDGGYPEGSAEPIAQLLQELQPNAVAFQGPGQNVIRWVGTESGLPSYPIWSTSNSSDDYGEGTYNASFFIPAESDTCFQTTCPGEIELEAPYGGCWFYNKKMCPKSLYELVQTYHSTIGQNSFLLLDLTPNQLGVLPESHLEAYVTFGDYLRNCYDNPVASSSFFASSGFLNLTGQEINQIVLQEELTYGQLVSQFNIFVDGVLYFNGSSIGNKFIFVLNYTIAPSSIEVQIVASAAIPNITITTFNCSVNLPPPSSPCQPLLFTKFQGPNIKNVTDVNFAGCCQACKSTNNCAVFSLDEVSTPTVCYLLSANSGTLTSLDYISGYPT